MPVYRLTNKLAFPPPEGADSHGVVAIGGDVRPERLMLAYGQGIFPWPHAEDDPLLWFSPDPRFVLPLDAVEVGRSLRKSLRRSALTIRFDTRFRDVMTACAEAARPGQSGTWITRELVRGYLGLHELGFAHSIEAFDGEQLVGGLYGVSLGSAFFGESMFARVPDASKIAFVTLLGHLSRWGFDFVDCQVRTDHLARFGAQDWPRGEYLRALAHALSEPTRRGAWRTEFTPDECVKELDARPLRLG